MQVFIDPDDYGAVILEVGMFRKEDDALRDAIRAAVDAAQNEVDATADAVRQRITTAPQVEQLTKHQKVIEEKNAEIADLRRRATEVRETSMKAGDFSLSLKGDALAAEADKLAKWLEEFTKRGGSLRRGITGSLRKLLADAHTKAADKHKVQFEQIQRKVEAFVESVAAELHRAGIGMKLHREAAKNASEEEL